jgi:hypothetical protein
MEVILASIFSTIILLITVVSLNKVFLTAYKRREISFRKFVVFSASSIVMGLLVAFTLPFGFQKIMDYIY